MAERGTDAWHRERRIRIEAIRRKNLRERREKQAEARQIKQQHAALEQHREKREIHIKYLRETRTAGSSPLPDTQAHGCSQCAEPETHVAETPQTDFPLASYPDSTYLIPFSESPVSVLNSRQTPRADSLDEARQIIQMLRQQRRRLEEGGGQDDSMADNLNLVVGSGSEGKGKAVVERRGVRFAFDDREGEKGRMVAADRVTNFHRGEPTCKHAASYLFDSLDLSLSHRQEDSQFAQAGHVDSGIPPEVDSASRLAPRPPFPIAVQETHEHEERRHGDGDSRDLLKTALPSVPAKHTPNDAGDAGCQGGSSSWAAPRQTVQPPIKHPSPALPTRSSPVCNSDSPLEKSPGYAAKKKVAHQVSARRKGNGAPIAVRQAVHHSNWGRGEESEVDRERRLLREKAQAFALECREKAKIDAEQATFSPLCQPSKIDKDPVINLLLPSRETHAASPLSLSAEEDKLEASLARLDARLSNLASSPASGYSPSLVLLRHHVSPASASPTIAAHIKIDGPPQPPHYSAPAPLPPKRPVTGSAVPFNDAPKNGVRPRSRVAMGKRAGQPP